MFALAASLHAQPGGSASDSMRGAPQLGQPPAAVTAMAISAWNTVTSRRVRGRVVVAPTDTITGTLVVLDGPLTLSGVVRGSVVAINADVRLDETTIVDGSLLVVGGVVTGRTRGRVAGAMDVWRATLNYREVDGQLVADEEATLVARYANWRAGSVPYLRDVLVTSAHTFNRVEGLAILGGPRLRFTRGNSRTELSALGIFRTGDRIAFDRENLGHRLRLNLQRGDDSRHAAIELHHVNEIVPVEDWTLSGAESGLTSVLFARDYRDYWNRRGGAAFLRLQSSPGVSLTLGGRREEWESRDAKQPWALFPSGRDWRANPTALEGTATLATLSATFDTRNDPLQPRDGWFLRADYEGGDVRDLRSGDSTRLALTAPTLRYGRGFVDLRRYNRIAPHTSINFRLVAGGLLHGDGLPAQRAVSVSGAGALPGFAFRGRSGDVDTGMCSVGTEAEYAARGRPAQCDRLLLLQAEWKGDFRIGLFGAQPRNDDQRWYADGLRADGTWVVFANSGRGWLVGDGPAPLAYPRGTIPLFQGFRTDVGVGLDFGTLGVYVAQPLTGSARTPRLFMRLGTRF